MDEDFLQVIERCKLETIIYKLVHRIGLTDDENAQVDQIIAQE